MTTKNRQKKEEARKSIEENGISLKPKTKNQTEYIRCIAENTLTFCSSIAGTGKSAVAIGMACEYIKENKVDKIIITRPTVECGRGIGYLPGDINEKFDVYINPARIELKKFLGSILYQELVSQKKILFQPLEYMRGYTFNDTFVIVDESQNCTWDQLKMVLTRLGYNSKMVIIGDIAQSDLYDNPALQAIMDKLVNIEDIGFAKLGASDIIRHKLVSSIIKALN